MLLLYTPEKVRRIVRACGVPHNMAQCYGIPLIEYNPPPPPRQRDQMLDIDPLREAIRSQQHLISTMWRQGHNLLFKCIYCVANISKDTDNLI